MGKPVATGLVSSLIGWWGREDFAYRGTSTEE
jgi:hypothetical protein